MPDQRPRPDQKPTPAHETIWALRIGTIVGIPIRIHFTFFLFLLWIGERNVGGQGLLNVLFMVSLFTCVLLHELGHSIVALRYGIPVADITLYPIGGIARIEKRPAPRQELWIALAGPAVNVVIAGLLEIVLIVLGNTFSASVRGFLQSVLYANVGLAVFNMVPAFPMDGGRVLRAILALNMPQAQATRIAAGIGQILAIAFGIFAALSQNWLWLFVAFFVYLGAGQESMSYQQASIFEGTRVKEAMITDVRTLSVGNTLREAADVLLATSQHDFPVMHGDEVQGVLTRNGLLRGLSADGPSAYVAGVMDREFESAGPNDDLSEALPKLLSRDAPIVVLDPENQNKFVGIVTTENVQELAAVRQIVAARNKA